MGNNKVIRYDNLYFFVSILDHCDSNYFDADVKGFYFMTYLINIYWLLSLSLIIIILQYCKKLYGQQRDLKKFYMEYNIIALSYESLRHVPCTMKLITSEKIGFEDYGKIFVATLKHQSPINGQSQKKYLNVVVSACHNGSRLSFHLRSVDKYLNGVEVITNIER